MLNLTLVVSSISSLLHELGALRCRVEGQTGLSDGSHKELGNVIFSFFNDRRRPNGHSSQTRELGVWELDL